jgi:hypothetical protein
MSKSKVARAIALLVAIVIVVIGVSLFFELRGKGIYLSIVVPLAFVLLGLDAIFFVISGRRGFGLISKERVDRSIDDQDR